MQIAIVDKSPNNGKQYRNLFDFKFDHFHLVGPEKASKKRLIIADVSLKADDFEDYDFVILVGADATRIIGKVTQVTKFAGSLVKDKFIPLINPSLVKIRPESQDVLDMAVKNIKAYVEGTYKVVATKYEAIDRVERAKEYLVEILNMKDLKTVAIDTETTAFHPRDGYVLGVSISHKTHHGVYISSDCVDEEIEELLQHVANKFKCVFHNAKFDMAMMKFHFGTTFPNWDCTMIMHYLLNENDPHDLKYLAMKYTDMGDYDRELDQWKRAYCRRHKVNLTDFTYDLFPWEIISPYAAADTDATLRLHQRFSPKIEAHFKRLYDNIMKPAALFLLDIQNTGVPFSKRLLLQAQESLDKKIYGLEQELYKFEEVHEFERIHSKVFNSGSTVHLGYLFFTLLKLPSIKSTPKGADSTDKDVLAELSTMHAAPALIGQIRSLKKIKSTYIDKVLRGIDRDGRLRTNFNLTVATSGRLSSSGKLNMQQLPRDDKTVKYCIVPIVNGVENTDYVFYSQDLSTAEMYYVSVLSGDKELQKVFRTGEDFHNSIAHVVFNLPCKISEVKKKYAPLRQAAKAVSFGILYGAGARKVAKTAGISIGKAQEVIDQYFEKFHVLEKWLVSTREEIKRDGYIYSLFGRKRRVPNVYSVVSKESGHAVRSAVNFTVQSVASDINLMASAEANDYLKAHPEIKAEIFALVHDSICGICHKDDLEFWEKKLKYFTQKDRRQSNIPGSPIGVDFEYGESYAIKPDVPDIFSEYLLDAA